MRHSLYRYVSHQGTSLVCGLTLYEEHRVSRRF